MSAGRKPVPQLDWLNPIKALALVGILLNHFVEEFGPGPWFTNPSNDWPAWSERVRNIFPHSASFLVSAVQFLGWLGDSGPGVFILASGLGLAWSALHSSDQENRFSTFFHRRLSKIFPLYVAMHFVILAGALVIPGSPLSFASRETLLSLFGLRFTNSLFFYISPSWWFVWTILQLYLMFPLLWRLMKKVELKYFLGITIALTIIFRLLGILFSHHLYYWMTGIFFGTRLAEFCVGMAVAQYLYRRSGKKSAVPSGIAVLASALPIYLIGLGCSFTLTGSLVSNLLVSIGLTGIFYGVWRILLSRIHLLASVVTWMGLESYGVYLLHQTPLEWTTVFFAPRIKLHLISAAVVLMASFPAAWIVEWIVNRVQRIIKDAKWQRALGVLEWVVSLATIAALLAIDHRLGPGLKYRAFSWLLALCLLFFGLMEFSAAGEFGKLKRFARWAVAFAAFAQLFLLPPQMGGLALMGGILFGGVALMIDARSRQRWRSWAVAAIVIVAIVAALEFTLARFYPVEAGRWGEYPALQPDPTRVYSLKPNQTTHLKYNNYDYVVRTNSFGMTSPEISVNRPTPDTLRILVVGDAFSMPEGLPYRESYPAILRRLLSEKEAPRTVQVIDAGVTGYGPAEELPQLKELCPLFKPDIVLYQFFIDEFTQAVLTRAERLEEIGFTHPQSSRFQHLLDRSQLIAHYDRWTTKLEERVTGKDAPWRYGMALLQYYDKANNSVYTGEDLEKVAFDLSEMSRVAAQSKAKFLVCFVPGAVAVSEPQEIHYYPWNLNLNDRSRFDFNLPWEHLEAISERLGIQSINLTPILKGDPRQPVYFEDSWHWNAEGHRIVAHALEGILDKNGWLEAEPPATHAALSSPDLKRQPAH